MAADLPAVLELLAAALRAGLPPGAAMRAVASRHRGELARELGRCASLIELGAGREAALAALRCGAPLPGVAVLCAALARSERHGTPLAPAIDALASEARATLAREAAERAARAAPKIQLVVALVIVPGVMLLLAAALLARV